MERRRQKRVLIKIDDIIRTTDRGAQVMITRTQKPAWVPNRADYFLPGHIFVPRNLADKICPPNAAPDI